MQYDDLDQCFSACSQRGPRFNKIRRRSHLLLQIKI